MKPVFSKSDQLGLNYPTLNPPYFPNPPVLPFEWSCTALLHPFSPPPTDDPTPDNPFFQLCLANIAYKANEALSIQVVGENYGEWWYWIDMEGTFLSVNRGVSWTEVDTGWTLPGTQWLANSVCVGNSALNWMGAQNVDWWKTPVPNSNASTWFWINTTGDFIGLPFRMMFGAPPSTPTQGDPNQLAFFQMFSFSYLVNYNVADSNLPEEWQTPSIAGFSFGNTYGYSMLQWNPNFGMTTFMTPVDEQSNPLPTRVFYIWKPDNEYQMASDRAQNTLMWYQTYNPTNDLIAEEALLFGVAPSSVQPPPTNSGDGYLIDWHQNGSETCATLPLGQEPPNWASIPAVDGSIHACISNNIELCPGHQIMLVSVLFPPTTEYLQGRYLWTWYSPFPNSNGSHARPVTFMESASTISEGGTSLALADYFDYQEYGDWLSPDLFTVPASCQSKKNVSPKKS